MDVPQWDAFLEKQFPYTPKYTRTEGEYNDARIRAFTLGFLLGGILTLAITC